MQGSAKKSKMPLIIVLILILVAAGVYAATQLSSSSESDDTMMQDDAMMEDDGMMEDDAMMEDISIFEVDASNFQFSVKEMRVKQGDRVRVVLSNVGGFHDWVIDEFNAFTPQIQLGEQAIVEFVADQKGTFEYYCSVGNHRAQGMVGTLIVE